MKTEQKEKPIYKNFDDDKDKILEMINEGTTPRAICFMLMKKYQVTNRVKFVISSLGVMPENQTTEQWLANYEHYDINKTFNKSYRG
jgi:hypothetical protein